MKKSLLQKWCGEPWLHATYLCGIVMMNILILQWNVWTTPQRLMALLTVFLPLHIIEELVWPNGFHFMMNKILQKSDNPLAYPENRLTDMITNFGAEVILIILVFLTPALGNKGMVFAAFFGFGETFVHTLFSALTLKHYRPMGKKTMYTPGFVTAWCLLLPVGVNALHWLITSGTYVRSDLWGLAFVAFLIIFMIRLPFIISNKVKSTKYAYDELGYFAKYEK